MQHARRFLLTLMSLLVASPALAAPLTYPRFGFARVDITPDRPMRLGGHAEREAVFEDVADRLALRVLALETLDGKRAALVSIETHGLPGRWTVAAARRVEADHGIPRSRLVLAATTTHSAPVLPGTSENFLKRPLTPDEQAQVARYGERLIERLSAAVGAAVADLAEGNVRFGVGRAALAVGRNEAAGSDPQEGSVPVLEILSPEGKRRGVLFVAACPGRVLPAEFNRVAGDWPGAAARMLEAAQPGSVALPLIGCAADALPVERGTPEAVTEVAGRVVAAIQMAAKGAADRTIAANPTFSFGYAGLAPERPSAGDLTKALLDRDIHVRRHAATMLKVLSRMGRLPESYPVPLHVWNLGGGLDFVFSGGELVGDYAGTLAEAIGERDVVVVSGCDDAFGIVTAKSTAIDDAHRALARMYELPGPWQENAEEVFVGRARELFQVPVAEEALSPAEALAAFRLSPGLEIELVAAEPLIADPVNLAFGPDGRLWVVEMGDYPRGIDGKGKAGGKVKFLEDTDADGRFDKATVFLDGLDFPTGAMPWDNGVLVSCAPDLLYAEDADGDGRADRHEVLYEGFTRRNPQHRVNGFALGIDNWVYVAANSDGAVKSTKTGKEVNLSGRDCRLDPRTGGLEPVNGHSQFGRERDDLGHWFGNENWAPIWHYLFPDRYVGRNPYVAGPAPWVSMSEEIQFPRVYPASRTVDRFNDLFTANRFTSGCSPTIYRDELVAPPDQLTALVCEPVHNLVHRLVLEEDGVNFRARRHPTELESEIIASTDTWFRPVRITTGPDGAIWIADMYRHVIEHPEWIPEVWQQRLDLRAGSDKGRIYRVFPAGKRPGALPRLAALSTPALVAALDHPNGWHRDTAQRLLVDRADPASVKLLEDLATKSLRPATRIQALATLDGLGKLASSRITAALGDGHPMVRSWGLVFSEKRFDQDPELADAAARLVDDPETRVRFQLALSLGDWKSPRAGDLLGRLAARDGSETWIRAAILSSAAAEPERILSRVLAEVEPSAERDQMVEALIATTVGVHGPAGLARALDVVTPKGTAPVESWHLVALGGLFDAVERGKHDLAAVIADGKSADSPRRRVERVIEAARAASGREDGALAERVAAARLLGRGLEVRPDDLARLGDCLSPRTAPELRQAAVRSLARIPDPLVPEILLAGWRSHVPELRGAILDVLLSRPDWTVGLLDAVERGDVLAAQIDASRRARLLEIEDTGLAERASRLLAAGPVESRASVLASYRVALELVGNSFRGALLFQKTCANCHEWRGRGKTVGANLAALQDRSSPALLVAILDPNKAVESKFTSYLATTTDGRVLSGMITAETNSSITLARADGKPENILRVDLDELVASGKSFMPEGLEKDLAPQDLADLFAFLQSAPLPRGSEKLPGPAATLAALRAGGGFLPVRLEGDGTRPDQSTWLGDAAAAKVGAEDEGAQATARFVFNPLPETLEPGQSYSFRMPLTVGGLSESSSGFLVRLAEAEVARVDPAGTDASWVDAEGSVHAAWLIVQADDDEADGILELELPGSMLTPGRPLELDIAPATKDGGRWLRVLVPDR